MHNPITQQHAEKLLDGTTKGPWTTFSEEWEEEVGNDTFMCGQHGIIGDRDGILDTRPVRSLMDAPDQWDETGEHNNAANVALAAASPDLAHTVIWLWKQHQQQQAVIDRLRETLRNNPYPQPGDLEWPARTRPTVNNPNPTHNPTTQERTP